MRLDKYLKVSRLIKRRTVANEVADAGRILINGKVAKASAAVAPGDVIEITFGNRPVKVRTPSPAPRTWPGRCTRSSRRARRNKPPAPPHSLLVAKDSGEASQWKNRPAGRPKPRLTT